MRGPVNKLAVRRWLAKALDDPTWQQVKTVYTRRKGTVVHELPEWAGMLHSMGAWRYLSYRQVSRIHFDPKLQRALIAAGRLGADDTAVKLILAEGLQIEHPETPSAWLTAQQPQERS